jgi:hypothetical protein
MLTSEQSFMAPRVLFKHISRPHQAAFVCLVDGETSSFRLFDYERRYAGMPFMLPDRFWHWLSSGLDVSSPTCMFSEAAIAS